MAEEHLYRAGKRSLDIAYGCFLFCGLFIGAFPISGVISEEVNLIFWFVAIPLTPLVLGGWLVGTAYAIRLWPHLPLSLLSLISLLFIAQLFSEAFSEEFIDASGWVYASIVTALPAWWFIIGRRRFP